ncbi:MAG: glycosyltransferase [Candidatus Latescibacterota bacterium]
MKVCLVGPAHPYRGGIAHFTSLLAKEFSREHDVSVINFKRLYPSFLFPGKTQFDDSAAPLQVEAERRIDSLNPWTYFTSARAIARRKPDMVVFQWWQPFFAFAYASMSFLLRRMTKAKIVFLCHNVLPHEASVFDRILIRIGLSGADAFLVQSREDEKNLRRLKGDVTAAINPHPIYDVFKRGIITREDARDRLHLNGRVLLFFGYIRAYKGLTILLEAFAKSLEQIESTLLIVGEFYEDPDQYTSLMDRLSIRDRIILVDRYVPNEDVEMYFAACDLVVLPYLSATQSGIVQISYGFGKPVIVTRVGGLPDVVDHGATGYVVPPGDPAAFADAIIDFFREDNTAVFEKNIEAAKGKFSWKRCVETLLALGASGQDRAKTK